MFDTIATHIYTQPSEYFVTEPTKAPLDLSMRRQKQSHVFRTWWVSNPRQAIASKQFRTPRSYVDTLDTLYHIVHQLSNPIPWGWITHTRCLWQTTHNHMVTSMSWNLCKRALQSLGLGSIRYSACIYLPNSASKCIYQPGFLKEPCSIVTCNVLPIEESP
jgi:hypothetical protein